MFDMQSTEAQLVAHPVRLVGGSSAISVDAGGAGYGIAASRTGTGAYKLAWSDNPGTCQGWSCALGAATPGDLAGHTVVRDTYDVDARELAFVLYNASDQAHDLAAGEYLDIIAWFRG